MIQEPFRAVATRPLDIKTTTALAITGGALLVLLLLALVQAHFARADVEEVVGNQQLAMLTRVADEIDERLAATRLAIAHAAIGTPAELIAVPERLKEHLASRPGFRSLFESIAVIGVDGHFLFDLPDGGRRGIYVGDREYFRRTLAGDGAQISAPFLSRPTNQPVIVFTAPIVDAERRIVGVLAGSLPLFKPNFLGKLAEARVGRTGEYALIGRDRTVIVSKDSARVMKRGPAPGMSEYFDDAVSGREGWRDATDLRGARALYSYKPLNTVPWTLLAALPADEAFAPVVRARMRVLGVGTVLVLALATLAWFGMRHLLAPLKALREGIGAMRANSGRFVPVTVARRDEIGDLADAYNEVMRERQDAEVALRTREAELHAANEASPLGVFRADAGGRCIYVNPAFARMAGITREACLQVGWKGAVHPDDLPGVQAYLRRAAEGGTAQHEHRFRHDDGAVVRVQVRTAPVLVDGRIAGYVSSVDDVTQRREDEAARRVLASILEASSDFVASSDPQGRILYVNPAGRRLRGIAPDADVSATRLADHHPAWVIDLFASKAVPVANRTGVWIGETAVYDHGRREVPVSHMIIAHRDPAGRVEYYSGIMRDMTADHAARRALRDSEERLRLITDNIPALVSYLDRETRFRFANQAYETWFDRPREAIYGTTLAEFYGADAYGRFSHHIEAALAGRTVTYERELAGAGMRRHVHVTLVPDFDDGTRVRGLYTLMHDITALKDAEFALAKMARHDGLTGLPNRNHFNETLERAIARSRRDGAMALMYLDVDKFKKINDSLGHGAGDAVLVEFAARLSSMVRETDFVARLGGDEFVVVLEKLHNPEEAQFVARKILAAIRRPFVIQGRTLEVSTSIGIAYLAGEVVDGQTLVQRADGALYAAKATGRDTYQMAKSRDFGRLAIDAGSATRPG